MLVYKVKLRFISPGVYEVSGYRKGWVFWHRLYSERCENFGMAAIHSRDLGKRYQKIPGARVVYD